MDRIPLFKMINNRRGKIVSRDKEIQVASQIIVRLFGVTVPISS